MTGLSSGRLSIASATLVATWLGFGQIAGAGMAETATMPKPAKSPPVWDDRLMGRIKVFLGGTRGAYVIPSRSAFANFFEAVGMKYSEDVEQVQYGWILNGFRYHSADEKGAVLFDDRRQVEATAIIHFDCYGEWRSLPGLHGAGSGCTDAPLLSVFVRRGPDASHFAGEMSAWADRTEGHHLPYKVVWVPPARRRK